MKPYYQDGRVAIYHGDCLDVLDSIPAAGGSDTFGRDDSMALVDLVVTSPPYNMGLVPGGNGRGMYRPGASNKAGRFREGYGVHADAMAQGEYDAWQRTVLAALWGRLRPSGAIFYNHRPRIEHGRLRLPLGMDFGELPLRQIIVWDRGTGIDVNLRSFCTTNEWVLLFAKPDWKINNHALSGFGNTWRLGMESYQNPHPAPFPVSLPERAIAAGSPPHGLVVDPFMGSGSTLVAAKNLRRRAIGIEVEERYCEMAAKRLAQEVMPLDEASVPVRLTENATSHKAGRPTHE